MSLLAVLTSTSHIPPLVVDDPEAVTVPYAMPTTEPYNAPTYCVTPSPDGTGSGLHPDVIDMHWHGGTFSGHRYWMAYTPWYRESDPLENPVVLHSDDGYTWHEPAGISNPIDTPTGTGDGHLSDTDLVYDPDTGRLWCYYRGSNYASTTKGESIWAKWSDDGTTWSDRVLVLAGPLGSTGSLVSPAIIRLATGSWVMLTNQDRRTATSPVGPWSEPVRFAWGGPRAGCWHLNAIWTGTHFWANMNHQRGPEFPAVSRDGIRWITGPDFLTARGGSQWDAQWLYRSSIQMHPERDKVRMWYSGHPSEPAATATTSWRIGYTHIPAQHWTALVR